MSSQLLLVKKGNQCLISSTHHTLTSILRSTSIRFRSVFSTKKDVIRQTTRITRCQIVFIDEVIIDQGPFLREVVGSDW